MENEHSGHHTAIQHEAYSLFPPMETTPRPISYFSVQSQESLGVGGTLILRMQSLSHVKIQLSRAKCEVA